MAAGNVQRYAAQVFAPEHKVEGGAAVAVVDEVCGSIVRVLHAVGYLISTEIVEKALYAAVVGAAYEHAVFGQEADKPAEGGNYVVHVFIVVQMVVVYVVYEGYRGAEGKEALHVFAGLGDEQIVGAYAGAAVEKIHKAADVYRSISAALFGYHGQHGGDSGFAVTACNSYYLLVALGELAQCNAALKLGYAPASGFRPLRVIRLYCGRVHYQIGIAYVFGLLADGDWYAQFSQPLGEGGGGAVAALYLVSSGPEYLGKAVHGATAYAYEMYFFMPFDMCHIFLPGKNVIADQLPIIISQTSPYYKRGRRADRESFSALPPPAPPF